MQVQAIEGSLALCEGRNGAARIDTLLVGRVEPGQWLLTHLGVAREIIDEVRAKQIDAALMALHSAASGNIDFDQYFSDLANQEPQLPDFLRGDPT